jgi:hypothetical protein
MSAALDNLSDAELDKRIDAHKNLDALMKTVRTLVLMKYGDRTPEQAQRITEFEFQYDHETDTIPELRYWFLQNRSRRSMRSIDLSADQTFQGIPPVKELKKVFRHLKTNGDDQN